MRQIRLHHVWSVSVHALVPEDRHRFAMRSSTPLYGICSLPRKTRCSSVCGRPSSSCASVARQRYPLTTGPPTSARMTRSPEDPETNLRARVPPTTGDSASKRQ